MHFSDHQIYKQIRPDRKTFALFEKEPRVFFVMCRRWQRAALSLRDGGKNGPIWDIFLIERLAFTIVAYADFRGWAASDSILVFAKQSPDWSILSSKAFEANCAERTRMYCEASVAVDRLEMRIQIELSGKSKKGRGRGRPPRSEKDMKMHRRRYDAHKLHGQRICEIAKKEMVDEKAIRESIKLVEAEKTGS